MTQKVGLKKSIVNILIKIRIEADGAIKYLDLTKSKIKNSLFASIQRATRLARAEVIDNIKFGMKKSIGWAKFSPATLRRKAKRGRSAIGLLDTGHMMQTIHKKTSRSRLEGVIYPGVEYLQYHEKGKGKMKRPVMSPVPKQINRKVIEIFKQELRRAI